MKEKLKGKESKMNQKERKEKYRKGEDQRRN